MAKDNLSTRKYEYKYDEFSKLIGEKNSYYGDFVYEYGKNGMLEKVFKNNELVKNFIYNTNKLTSVMIDDKIYPIEYDNYGNILSIGNAVINYNSMNLLSGYEFTIKINSYTQIREKYKYYYNYYGIRHKKELSHDLGGIGENVSYVNYYLKGNKILGENWVDLNGNITKKIRYFYDVEGVSGLRYDGYNFTFIRDSLDNISKVMYKGKIIGEYVYDAWGNHEVVELSVTNDRDRFVLYNNPFRYKGYYCDLETGLYYCNARYYNPILGQWISPDSLDYLDYEINNGINLYCYCYNNPISYMDVSGNYPIYMASKGHQGNQRQSDFNDLTNDDVSRRLNELKHKKRTKSENIERQKLVKEQKARGKRNKKKREGYKSSKFELNYNSNYNIEIIPMSKKSEPSMELIPTSSNDSFLFDWDLAGKVAGGAMIVVGVVGAIIIIADDATLVGIADDAPGLAALWALICEGWHMIFG